MSRGVGAGARPAESEFQPTPVGRKTRFRHPDGLVVEYVDHVAVTTAILAPKRER
jgi:hypothetical protein